MTKYVVRADCGHFVLEENLSGEAYKIRGANVVHTGDGAHKEDVPVSLCKKCAAEL